MRRVNYWWSRVALNVSGECYEEEYDCRRVIPLSEKMCIIQHQSYIPRGALLQAAGLGAEGETGAIWPDSAAGWFRSLGTSTAKRHLR